MIYFYIAVKSKSHAFLLERRMNMAGIKCDLVFLPREIMKDLCNMGVRFDGCYIDKAIQSIKNSGLPGCRLYKENAFSNYSKYIEVPL